MNLVRWKEFTELMKGYTQVQKRSNTEINFMNWEHCKTWNKHGSTRVEMQDRNDNPSGLNNDHTMYIFQMKW